MNEWLRYIYQYAGYTNNSALLKTSETMDNNKFYSTNDSE